MTDTIRTTGVGAPCRLESILENTYCTTPVAQSAPRNLLTRWDVSSIPANGIFLTKN